MKIRCLMLHAYGMGGTIRTVVNQANAMAAAGHDVELVSLVRRREKPRLDQELTDASVYALSSRFEGLPMVMIEAMTHALPVVAFDCPTGPRDVPTDGVNGVLVPPRDVDAPAAAPNRVIADRKLRLRMGKAALRTSRAYGPEQIMPLWEDLSSELAAGERVTDNFWTGR